MSYHNKFWLNKKLEDFTPKEWELLCDGCGKCCLHKLEYLDGEIDSTNIACELLDIDSCICKNYQNRKKLQPDCIKLTPKRVKELKWLPKTCAYRLINEGKPLPVWHYLISGDKQTVHQYMMSVKGRAVVEKKNMKFEKHIVDWDDL